MYAYINGKLVFKGLHYIIVETAGVGYKIFTSGATLARIGAQNDVVKVYTHLHVKEDEMSLFGFLCQEELSMFELLITVSGVGPKVALAMLTAVTPSRFSLAVITNDAKTLTQAQGVGIKLAQRIILELKDKLEKEQKNAGNGDLPMQTDDSCTLDSGKMTEAVKALGVLGYSVQEANMAVASVYSEEKDVERIIFDALKGLA